MIFKNETIICLANETSCSFLGNGHAALDSGHSPSAASAATVGDPPATRPWVLGEAQPLISPNHFHLLELSHLVCFQRFGGLLCSASELSVCFQAGLIANELSCFGVSILVIIRAPLVYHVHSQGLHSPKLSTWSSQTLSLFSQGQRHPFYAQL